MDPPSAPQVVGTAHPEDAPDEFWTADNLWARICDGKSFVHEQDRVSPWYLASNPIGTQMANLVCAIDPLCQLFVAKIADSHYGYSAARAAEAVNWAVDRGVDIISMSFTTTEDYKPFKEAVQKTMNAGILIVCSHHDNGARIGTQVFPACFNSNDSSNTMLRMASCNMYGKLQHDWDDNTTDNASKKNHQHGFCINSQDIAVGAIPFLAASTERISGSSVATAIAAGVCSLLIACLRTLHGLSKEEVDGNVPRGQAIIRIRENVAGALGTCNRPTYKNIRTMVPSTTNPQFISLDRFARLEELRNVNNSSLSQEFNALGAELPGKSEFGFRDGSNDRSFQRISGLLLPFHSSIIGASSLLSMVIVIVIVGVRVARSFCTARHHSLGNTLLECCVWFVFDCPGLDLECSRGRWTTARMCELVEEGVRDFGRVDGYSRLVVDIAKQHVNL
ncbi:hypothetical protein GCG54_00006554 [Colletotrichum gloeosporioides]|uniref:Peptidase S8/S53 domain-containing protein n=1 Tax=Colletotrichum gloeosporioides TaxID=474922 RepID=A0A8H4FNP7_COLGL|nr:uncharacterized protein GCG54_00006554 [Colletotrichum gloeosporioides]KAF3808686.1 hypothetical protein GCG54_00006554 [Colletotrichum gloeosporioides]